MICMSICYAMQHGIDVVNKVYSKESVLFTFFVFYVLQMQTYSILNVL